MNLIKGVASALGILSLKLDCVEKLEPIICCTFIEASEKRYTCNLSACTQLKLLS